jgi:hypothetical protein
MNPSSERHLFIRPKNDYLEHMKILSSLLTIIFLLTVALGATADPVVPQSHAQITLTFAPLVILLFVIPAKAGIQRSASARRMTP